MINNDLHSIFSALKVLISRYQPPLVVKGDDATHYDLWFVKDLVIAGRKRKEVFFAGLIIQKSYVGFYFMPVYTDAEAMSFIKPELLKRLKGKSCFYIKNWMQSFCRKSTSRYKPVMSFTNKRVGSRLLRWLSDFSPIGRASHFGGVNHASLQLDMVLLHPQVWLDDALILQDGKLRLGDTEVRFT